MQLCLHVLQAAGQVDAHGIEEVVREKGRVHHRARPASDGPGRARSTASPATARKEPRPSWEVDDAIIQTREVSFESDLELRPASLRLI